MSHSADIVLLGTGTPNAEPDRAGSSLAILAGGRPYLVDFGPGVVRQAAAAHAKGVSELAMPNLTHAFLTHMHSDHTAGYPDLILTPWVLGRREPLQVYGPAGLASMTEHITQAYAEDICERVNGLEPTGDGGVQVDVTEISPGPIYQDHHLSVQAFPVRHGPWPAFGFRFSTADREIVVSGDTTLTADLADHYRGCDILIHEVYSNAGLAGRPEEWQRYHRAVHTSTTQLAEIANQVRPGLLVLVHQLYWGVSDEELLAEIRQDYDGPVRSGRDLDIF